MLKAGENGRGIQSRWYPETLQRRINHITHQTDKLSFIFGDGLEVIQNNLDSRDTCYFIDPPYTAAGKRPGSRLYNHSEIDHESLFALASSIEGDFLMTYNNHEEIIRLANRHGFDTEPIAMRNTHHAKKTELLISHDLSWIRQSNSD